MCLSNISLTLSLNLSNECLGSPFSLPNTSIQSKNLLVCEHTLTIQLLGETMIIEVGGKRLTNKQKENVHVVWEVVQKNEKCDDWNEASRCVK